MEHGLELDRAASEVKDGSGMPLDRYKSGGSSPRESEPGHAFEGEEEQAGDAEAFDEACHGCLSEYFTQRRGGAEENREEVVGEKKS
jgi:hypothetical protein